MWAWVLTLVFLGASPAWAKTIQHDVYLTLDCQDSLFCALDLTARLEAQYGCKLHADTPTDTVCGAVQIVHCHPDVVAEQQTWPASRKSEVDEECRSTVLDHHANHHVRVDFYDAAEAPDVMQHPGTTLQPPAKLPSQEEVEAVVQATPKGWERTASLIAEAAAKEKQRQAALESGNAKLKALGLTEAELKELAIQTAR